MGFPFNVPGHIKDPDDALRRGVEIQCYGMGTDCLSGILVGDSYWLEGCHASISFYLIPYDESIPIDYSIDSHYADCISFEHEIPTLALPSKATISNEDVPWLIKPTPLRNEDSRNPNRMYVDYLRYGAEAAADVSNGPWLRPSFRYDYFYDDQLVSEDGFVRIEWMSKYQELSLAIHLYAAALRQSDPLSQYLCFYRVLENINRTNSKSWVEDTIECIDQVKLEPIWHLSSRDSSFPIELMDHIDQTGILDGHQRINVAEIARSYALRQIINLRDHMENKEIAKRLYNENRCGIAHGKEIKPHDLGSDFSSILNDLLLIRLLARIAITQKVEINPSSA